VSLEETLRAWAGARSSKPTFTIISGSATAVNKARLEASCGPAKVEFHATLQPEEKVVMATLRYLGVVDDSSTSFAFKDRVAVLYESNTTIGWDAMSGVRLQCSTAGSKEHEPGFFPGEWEQGYYNAAIALLSPKESPPLLEYGPPFPPLVEESDWYQPPVWISIVGQGGVFPLAVVPLKPGDPLKPDHPLKPGEASADYVFRRDGGVAGGGPLSWSAAGWRGPRTSWPWK
jgi:hypothetical protein